MRGVALAVLFGFCTLALAPAARAQGFFSSSPGPLTNRAGLAEG